MDRAEAEAIYDSGREACVEFILDLVGRFAQHEDRLKRLEEQARRDSRTSSRPPSMAPPKSRAQRRTEARAKAKELMRREGERREAGGQPGHLGAGRELRPEDQIEKIVDHLPGGCNREQFNALLGASYPGIVVSDRWNRYSHLDPHQRQVCWSHLQRDFRRHADGLGGQKTFGEHGVPLANQVFAAWRAYQHEHHDRDRLKTEIAPLQTKPESDEGSTAVDAARGDASFARPTSALQDRP